MTFIHPVCVDHIPCTGNCASIDNKIDPPPKKTQENVQKQIYQVCLCIHCGIGGGYSKGGISDQCVKKGWIGYFRHVLE